MRPIRTAPISIQASGLTAQAALVGPRISEDPSIFKAIKTLSETEEKTRNCVETFLPHFPGDLLIDFSSFHMENRYFGISNFPLGPQDGYSAPPGPKIFKPFLQPQRSTLVLLSSLQSIQCNVHTLCNSLCVSGGQVGYILWEVLLPLHTLLVMPSYSPSQNLFSLFRAV